MALLAAGTVLKKELITIKAFAALMGNVSSSAIYYAIEHDMVDYYTIGDRSYIVITKLTRAYKPNDSPLRKKPVKKKKRHKRA